MTPLQSGLILTEVKIRMKARLLLAVADEYRRPPTGHVLPKVAVAGGGLVALAGLGVGALNETFEFVATVARSGSHVGG